MARNYAKNARREGEISASEAAEQLGVHARTIHVWAKDAIAGTPDAKLSPEDVRRDIMGRYWLDSSAVERLPDRLRIEDYI